MHIDVYDPDNYTAGIPHAQFAWLRENAPVYWQEHPAGHGYWVLSKHADVRRRQLKKHVKLLINKSNQQ